MAFQQERKLKIELVLRNLLAGGNFFSLINVVKFAVLKTEIILS